MTNSKYFFLHITLLILFLSLPLSYAHTKSQHHSPHSNYKKCQCPCPCKSPPDHKSNKSPSPPQKSNDGHHPSSSTPEKNEPPPEMMQDDGNQSPPPTSQKHNSPPQKQDEGNQFPPEKQETHNQSPPEGQENGNESPPSTLSTNTQSPPSTPSTDTQPPPSTPSTDTQPPPSTPSTEAQSPPSNPSTGKSPPSLKTNISFGGSFTKVFAFGDSFTDTGNAFLLGGLKSFVGSLISTLHGGSSLLPGHRQCNGRLVVDFLCENLGIPYLPPYKKTSSDFSFGANFAVAGATSLTVDYFTKHSFGQPLMWKGIPLNFDMQVDWYNKFIQGSTCKGKSQSECKAEIEGSLFWLGEIGGNDYARTFASPLSKRWLTDLALDHVHRLLKTLLDSGAKYIVVQGLPPIGCCPIEMFLAKMTDRDPMGCASSGNALIQAHNELLQTMLDGLRAKYPGCTIAYADYWNAYKTILENRQKYHFAEPFKACCGGGGGPLNFHMNSLCGSIGTSTCQDPSQYMHWDGLHFTEKMHSHLADLFLHQGFCKPSFHDLVKKKMGM